LVPNDFPYDVDEGIEHWCLWKIGGASSTESISMGELAWAIRELRSSRAHEIRQKTRADLPSRWRADLPFLLLEEKITNKKKKGRSARGQKKRTPLLCYPEIP
jgi:hypothetical protein